MEFEWDEGKYRSNLVKHGVDFVLVSQFEWPRLVIEPDLRRDYGEPRFIARGYGPDGKGYVLAFTTRAARLRIISLRRFNRREYIRYGQ